MESIKRKPAVFLDRDGTFIVDRPFLSEPEGVELFPETIPALRGLMELGFRLIVISNQSGVARGYFGEEAVERINSRFRELLEMEGVLLDGIYYCPNHPDAIDQKYRANLQCRKPNTGMVDRAVQEMEIDLSSSFVVGDKLSDVELAHNLNITGILVKTGYGLKALESMAEPDFPIAENMLDVLEIIRRTCEG